MNPYKVTKETMEELHSRSQRKIKQLFPEGTPDEILKRVERESTALARSPYIYALLIAEEVIKKLREHRFTAYLDGEWFCCYFAWLLDLTKDDPFWLAKYYQSIGWRLKHLVRDKCIESPIEIAVSPRWAKPACLELLRMHADEWGFWLGECPEGGYKLINIGRRPDDIYAASAPIIRIVDGD